VNKQTRGTGSCEVLAAEQVFSRGLRCGEHFAVRWVWWLYWLRVRQMRAPLEGRRTRTGGCDIQQAGELQRSGIACVPGAKPHKDEKNDPRRFKWDLGQHVWVQLAVMKLESNDAPEKVRNSTKKRWRSTARF